MNPKIGALLLLLFCAPAMCAESAADLVFPPSRIDTEVHRYRLDPERAIKVDPAAAIDAERLAATLMKLLVMPSRSCREKIVAMGAMKLLSEAGGSLGIRIRVDNVPAKAAALPATERKHVYCDNGHTAPQSGNLIALVPGDAKLPSWNLSFHLDTNQLRFDGIHREGDVIHPGPGSPLGADDKAGLAIITEVLRVIAAQRIPHGDIRIVGLVAEEDGSAGAQLIDGDVFRGDVVVSIDGGDPGEIGRAAPTSYGGYITVRTQTSHPADIHAKKTVSACAVGAHILVDAGFQPWGNPDGHPDVVLHSYFTSCGIDNGRRTPKGHPAADFQYNTISPFWSAAWQLRSLEGPPAAAEMAQGIAATVDRVCADAARDRTPVTCAITGADRPSLTGYVIPADSPVLELLGTGFVVGGAGPVRITAQQFGGFNGNYIKERFGEEMVLLGTAADQEHTNQESVSVSGMARVARGLLSAMLQSWRYTRLR